MKKYALMILLLAGGACDVDETGYFAPDEVDYSSDEELEEGKDSEVVVVGDEGAVERAGGELGATNLRTGASASVAIVSETGSFVLRIAASLGDSIELSYELDGTQDTMQLALADDLSSHAMPSCTICTGTFLQPPDEAGLVGVSLSLLSNVEAPELLLFNVSNGSVVVVPGDSADASIGGAVGDEICVFARDDSGSPALCALVPAQI
jgi:hypothetical protein